MYVQVVELYTCTCYGNALFCSLRLVYYTSYSASPSICKYNFVKVVQFLVDGFVHFFGSNRYVPNDPKKAAAFLPLPYLSLYYVTSESIKKSVSGMNASAIDIHFGCFVQSIFHELFESLKCIDNRSHLYYPPYVYPLRDLFFIYFTYIYGGALMHPRTFTFSPLPKPSRPAAP